MFEMPSGNPRRVNGLQRPFVTAQVSTWVLLPLLILQFCIFASPLLLTYVAIPVTIVFIGLGAFAAYSGYQTMKIDPSDPRLLGDDHQDEIDNSEPTKHCWLCDLQVNEKSMHCKFCNKCVDHFDHHCMWMNTCVGKKNYKYFYRTMVNIIGFLLIHFLVQFVLVLDLFVGFGDAQDKAEKFIGKTPMAVFMLIFLSVDLVTLSLMFQLWYFHLRLQRLNLTTYQYIIQDSRRRREQEAEERELELKRESEMAKALAEKRSVDYYKLLLGGKARKCSPCLDPIQSTQKNNVSQEQQQQDDKEEDEDVNETGQNGEPTTEQAVDQNGEP